MSPKNLRGRLFHDILDAISMIEESMGVAAVERKLQIISEAAIRLGSEAEQLCPGLPWRAMRGMGNHLRHAYERVDLEVIWAAVNDDIVALKAGVSRIR